MLSPPNQGSEIVDEIGDHWLVKEVIGPTGSLLGTGPDGLPRRLDLEQLVGETGLAEVTPTAIRKSLERQFDIGYVSVITPREIRVKPHGAYYNVTAQYDDRVHLFGNVDVVMSFDKTVKVPRT